MDPTQMQQTVIMDSMVSGVSVPQETHVSICNSDSTFNHVEQNRTYEPLSYDELFPELPNAKLNPNEGEAEPNSWANNCDMRIQSSVITQMFWIPSEERAKIDGNNQFGESASSRICNDITARTGAHIEISTAKDQSLTFLITGKNDGVLKAKKLILEKFQTQAKQVVQIPKDHHRFILGKKGKNLLDLESRTGTKIDMPKVSDVSTGIVVTGTREAIEKAVHEIQLISDEQSKQAHEKLIIPKIYHPFMNPQTNEALNRIVSENTVRINIPPNTVDKNDISIVGEKEAVLMCKELILNIYREMEQCCKTIPVEVPRDQHKYVIGPKGANLSEIMIKNRVVVEVPSPDSESDTIILRGPHANLGRALTRVYEMASSTVKRQVYAPAWLHKYIIGKKGANIKQLTEQFPEVNVELHEDKSDIILEGPKQEVELAVPRLEDMINDMQIRLANVELTVDHQYHRNLIGKNGSNINPIRQRNQVLISISDVDANIIKIEGKRDGVEAAKAELLEIVHRMQNEVTKEITVSSRFHRQIIGSKGEKIKEIREQFNQVQITLPDVGADKNDWVRVRGSKVDVEACCEHLKNFTNELSENNHQIKLAIYQQFHKYIVGKSGVTVNKIRDETNAKIDLPPSGDYVLITGRRENCEAAKQMIQKIQNEMSNTMELEIMIPAKFHNSMIGPGGKLIRSISEECGGVNIKFPNRNTKSDKVSLQGPKEDVMRAKQMLVDLSQEKQLHGFTAEVKAKPELHRFLIGRQGGNIKKIRDKTNARIIFPSDDDVIRDVITIIGKKENVEEAKSELSAMVQELSKMSEEVIVVEPKYYRHFTARRGEILRQIEDDNGGVTISFPRQGDPSNKVTIKGVKECIDGAKQRITEIVDDLEKTVTITAEIMQKHHRTILGFRGAKVQALQAEHDVMIKFPERDNGSNYDHVNAEDGPRPQDLIQITGLPEKCEATKEALLELIPIKKEIAAPFKYHRFLIGEKGKNVRALMQDHDVNIQVPQAQDKKDCIWVEGCSRNVESCHREIEKKIEALKLDDEDKAKRSFTLEVVVANEFHSKIIGKRGATVRKIREKHDVNLLFPIRGDSNEDIIKIVGYEENCKNAEEEIFKITGDLNNLVKETISINPKVHPRLIGLRGRNVRKIMDEFKVDIRFPRNDENPDKVMIVGKESNVEECIDALLNAAEEFLQDIADNEDTRQYMVHRDANSYQSNDSQEEKRNGFILSGAPWTQAAPDFDSSEDFPSMGSAAVGSASSGSLQASWGPKKM